MTDIEKEQIIKILKEHQPKTIEELTELLIDRTGAKKKEVKNIILNMVDEKYIEIIDSKTELTLINYIMGVESLWFWSIVFVIFLYLVSVIITNTISELLFFRYIFGGLLVLFVPGYSLVKVLTTDDQVITIERVALSIGLSLAITPMTSFVLNFTPWGINLTSIVFSLSIVTMSLALFALHRRFSNKREQLMRARLF